jgi:hypothetical protein
MAARGLTPQACAIRTFSAWYDSATHYQRLVLRFRSAIRTPGTFVRPGPKTTGDCRDRAPKRANEVIEWRVRRVFWRRSREVKVTRMQSRRMHAHQRDCVAASGFARHFFAHLLWPPRALRFFAQSRSRLRSSAFR